MLESINGVDLDPDFFTSEGQLLEDISAVLQMIVQDVLSNLAEKGFSFEPSLIILTGSLVGPNWDDNSDVDLHIVLDFQQFEPDEIELWKEFLRLYAKDFNSKGYTLAGRDLEIYFQDTSEPHSSPAVYDILSDKWIAEPSLEQAEVLDPESENIINDIVSKIDMFEDEENNVDDYKKFLDKLHEQFDDIRKLRKEGMAKEGFKSQGNLIFKRLRRNGYIKKLLDMILRTQNKVYDVNR